MSSTHRGSSVNRGRPRKSPTAAPDTVRRTQLREAQRAYRSRQQSLLASLKSRVSSLEDALGQLGHIMESFDAQVIKPGAQMSHAQLLQAMKLLQNDIFSQLKRADCHISPNQGDCSSTTQSQLYQQTASGRHSPGSCRSNKTTTSASTWTKEKALSSDFWRRFMSSSNGFLPPVKPMGVPNPCIPITSSINIDNQVIEYTTTAFTERLYRACAEIGYCYLKNDAILDEEMRPQFGLLFRSVSRDQIQVYFEQVLQMRPCNPVYDRRFPFMSLGGAGTHFPSTAQNPRSQNLLPFHTTNGVLELPSDEEWFDVKDVEGFLIEQGIQFGENYQAPCLPTYNTSGNLNMRHDLSLQKGNIVRSSDTTNPGQATTGMIMVLDEATVIDRLRRLCVCLGCVAGFRRSDVERLVWQNVIWKPA
ncbi:hypothetical protein BDV28DRAFT_50383 [Aspergillus coremiiformis]|uniref:BZIP domain-containing protein n=1 Tax=Aspergillus coremiiformis TaxID=138285 RepID=A0A5N6YWY9_9EURO|nr:hypothetical protein BDV28DRAFT_50383 [Aspergillus coremiiformis]